MVCASPNAWIPYLGILLHSPKSKNCTLSTKNGNPISLCSYFHPTEVRLAHAFLKFRD